MIPEFELQKYETNEWFDLILLNQARIIIKSEENTLDYVTFVEVSAESNTF